MNNHFFGQIASRGSRAGSWVLQAAALALIIAMALPARATGDRIVKSQVAPIYPAISMRMGITGEVLVRAVVDANGRVKSATAVSGDPSLRIAAENAVLRWRFTPGEGDSALMVGVNFEIPN